MLNGLVRSNWSFYKTNSITFVWKCKKNTKPMTLLSILNISIIGLFYTFLVHGAGGEEGGTSLGTLLIPK